MLTQAERTYLELFREVVREGGVVYVCAASMTAPQNRYCAPRCGMVLPQELTKESLDAMVKCVAAAGLAALSSFTSALKVEGMTTEDAELLAEQVRRLRHEVVATKTLQIRERL